MKKLTILFALLISATTYADNVRVKTPAINGKIIVNNLELTDWQAVISCHFNYQGTRKESIRYPQTLLNKIDANTYALKIKAGSLSEFLPHWELLTCAYKLILIGKNSVTHQVAFGEIFLMGKESGSMSEGELQAIQDTALVTKILNDKTKELAVIFGKDGGIVEDI
ncbi:MAG: hypothetical protein Q7U04_16880 [Bacteriovorax sp.]|nr:hypothetical protein [Bacteriovorax sp.]